MKIKRLATFFVGIITVVNIHKSIRSMQEVHKTPLSLTTACIDYSYKNPKIIGQFLKKNSEHPLYTTLISRYATLIGRAKNFKNVTNLLRSTILDEEKISFLAGVALFKNEKTSFAVKKKFFDTIKKRFTKGTERAKLFSELDTFFSDPCLEPIGFNVITSQRLYKKQTYVWSKLFSKKYTSEPLLYHILTTGSESVVRYILQYYGTVPNLVLTDLKESGKRFFATRSFSVSPYSIPLVKGNTDILCALNAHARDNNDTIFTKKVDLYGNDVFHYAAKRAGMQVIRCLLECGASVDQLNKHGETPLHSAIKAQNYEGIKSLLYCGADMHALDKNGYIPLLLAVNIGNATIVRYLLENGCKGDIHYSNNRCTVSPLVQASLKNDKTLVWLLQELCECTECTASSLLMETI